MSWVTVIWSAIVAVCLTLAVMHGLVWCQNRKAWGNLVFSGTATLTAVTAGLELLAMRIQAPGEYAALNRWGHVPVFLLFVTLAVFVRLYLHAGRPWLAWSAVGVRFLCLVANFSTGESLNFRKLTAIQPVRFLGETVSTPEGVPNPWMMMGSFSLLLLAVFFAEAMTTVWRRGERRRALLVGGSMLVSMLSPGVHSILIVQGVYHLPFLISPFYLCFIFAMNYELSRDLALAAELSRRLQTSQAALLDSEESVDLAAAAANLGLWSWNLITEDILATPKARQMFGLPASERLDSDRFLQCVHPDDRQPVTHAVAMAMNGDGEFEAEYRVVVAGRATSWIAAHGHVEFSRLRKPVRLRGVSIDITERKRAEEKLRQLSHAVEQSPVLVVITDLQAKIIYVNRKFSEVTGYSFAESVGQNPRILKSGESSPAVYQELWACLTSGKTWRGEFHNRRKNGELYWEAAVISPLLDAAGRATHYVGIKADITERKQAEQDLQQQRAELTHMSRVTMLGELSGSLAHELNQPLGIILSNAQAAQELLAQNPPAVAEVSEILSDIEAADRRAGEIIQRLRALLKRGDTPAQSFPLNDIFEEVLRIVRADLIGRGVTPICHFAPDLPPITGDRVQLQQLALNLILNATDAMAANAPGLRRLHLMTTRHQNAVRASVRDEGAGLPADVERLFQPFFTTKAHGLGMGLAICRTIIAAHHGRLWAEPHPERGAVFHIELPVAADEAPRTLDAKPPPPATVH